MEIVQCFSILCVYINRRQSQMDQDSTILISDQRLQQEIENGMDN